MTDRPIIFSAPMVQALLAGRKTMTRRLAFGHQAKTPDCFYPSVWQKVRPGDRLWVREAFTVRDGHVFYRAGPISPGRSFDEPMMLSCRPSIHMPRKLSRLTLFVTAVKIERLQKISAADIAAEGVECGKVGFPRAARAIFSGLWDSLHGPGAWKANPEVVVLTFTVHRCNIDAPHRRRNAAKTRRARKAVRELL